MPLGKNGAGAGNHPSPGASGHGSGTRNVASHPGLTL